MALSRTVFARFDIINTATLKSESEVTHGHRNWHHSIVYLWFLISVLQ